MLNGITLVQAIYDLNKRVTTFRFPFSNEQASSLADLIIQLITLSMTPFKGMYFKVKINFFHKCNNF